MLPAYLAELKKIKLLAPEEERALWEAEKAGDGEAHQKLMASYQPLVFKIAVSFRLQEEVTMELIQEGMVGLLEAAESYDHTRGVAFSLFAMHRIRGRMCDFLTREHANEFLSLDWESENGSTLADFLPSQQPVPEEIAERHAADGAENRQNVVFLVDIALDFRAAETEHLQRCDLTLTLADVDVDQIPQHDKCQGH